MDRTDSKVQVTMKYDSVNKPVSIEKIVCSTQHEDAVDIDDVRAYVDDVIRKEITEYDLRNTEFLINPTGRFVIGGPDGDTGLTGRKIIVDTYGGYAPMAVVLFQVRTVLKFTEVPIYGTIFGKEHCSKW